MTKKYEFDAVSFAPLADCSGFVVIWELKNLGFGEVYFELDEDNGLQITSEHMGKDFAKALLNYLVDNATLVD